jgi:hypothetical protein
MCGGHLAAGLSIYIGVIFHSHVLFLLLMCSCVIFTSQVTSVPMHKFADFKKTYILLFVSLCDQYDSNEAAYEMISEMLTRWPYCLWVFFKCGFF